jgi:hypothetical protein
MNTAHPRRDEDGGPRKGPRIDGHDSEARMLHVAALDADNGAAPRLHVVPKLDVGGKQPRLDVLLTAVRPVRGEFLLSHQKQAVRPEAHRAPDYRADTRGPGVAIRRGVTHRGLVDMPSFFRWLWPSGSSPSTMLPPFHPRHLPAEE